LTPEDALAVEEVEADAEADADAEVVALLPAIPPSL
jgi:hypothetical protein